MISNLVFTKNRPLQLEGYLASVRRHLPEELIQTYIVYKPELFDQQYADVFRQYPDHKVIRERQFHSDLLQLLDRVETEYILFGVDDVVYFDSVSFEVIDGTFRAFDQSIFGFSLRLDRRNITDPHIPVGQATVAGQTVYNVNWPLSRMANTHYPFELCATVYRTDLVRKVINGAMSPSRVAKRLFAPDSLLISTLGSSRFRRKLLKAFGYFYSPNTLESWNCRWCQNNCSGLPAFLFFQKTRASAIQVNLVNSSTNNDYDGSDELTVEALAEKYRQGYRFDLDFVAKNKPVDTHSGQKHFKLRYSG